MRTFDEAVGLVLTAPNGITVDEMARLHELQMGFRQEVCANVVMRDAVEIMTEQVVNDICALGDSDEEVKGTPTVIAGGLLSCFMWGLAVGRKMEEQEMPAL